MALRLRILEQVLHRLHLLPTPVMDAFGGVLFGRVLAVAVRRGLIQAAAGAPQTATGLALRTGLDLRATQLLCDALTVGGYLQRTPAGYEASAEARTWLLPDSPRSLYHLVLYFETLHGRWQQIEHALVHGAPARPYYATFNESDWETYVLGMRDLARLLLPGLMRRVKLPREGRLLDLGGSHALYSIACCRKRPGLTATIMDFEGALNHARRHVEAEGMTGRFSFLAGDFVQEACPPDQDLILMFNIIHGFDAATNRSLVARALDSLRPGGRLYILDQFALRGGGSPLSHFIPLMVGLNLLSEAGGTVYTVDEVISWCAGRGEVRRRKLPLPGVGLLEVTA